MQRWTRRKTTWQHSGLQRGGDVGEGGGQQWRAIERRKRLAESKARQVRVQRQGRVERRRLGWRGERVGSPRLCSLARTRQTDCSHGTHTLARSHTLHCPRELVRPCTLPLTALILDRRANPSPSSRQRTSRTSRRTPTVSRPSHPSFAASRRRDGPRQAAGSQHRPDPELASRASARAGRTLALACEDVQGCLEAVHAGNCPRRAMLAASRRLGTPSLGAGDHAEHRAVSRTRPSS